MKRQIEEDEQGGEKFQRFTNSINEGNYQQRIVTILNACNIKNDETLKRHVALLIVMYCGHSYMADLWKDFELLKSFNIPVESAIHPHDYGRKYGVDLVRDLFRCFDDMEIGRKVDNLDELITKFKEALERQHQLFSSPEGKVKPVEENRDKLCGKPTSLFCLFTSPFQLSLFSSLIVSDKSLLEYNESSSNEGTEGVTVLQNAVNAVIDTRKYHRCLSIIQSSGYGKTRACLTLAHLRRCVYIMCDATNDLTPGISQPPIIGEIITMICNSESARNRFRLANAFIEAIIAAAKKYNDPNSLFQAQFEDGGNFFGDLRVEWVARRSNETPEKVHATFKEEYSFFDSAVDTAASAEAPKLDMTTSSSTDATEVVLIEPLIIFFDEAHTLSTAPNDVNSPIRQISRIINKTDYVNVIGIFLSTSGKIDRIFPGHEHSRSIEHDILDYPPINQICTINIFKDHIFLRGRPLWKAIHTYYSGDFNKVVEYALRRLVNNHQLDSIIALLAARFALHPVQEFADRMVANHLATLVNVKETKNGRLLTVKYHSEPILAEASAYITSSLFKHREINCSLAACLDTLRTMLKSAREFIGPNKGDIGELIGAVALAFNVDRTRISSMIAAGLSYNANNVNCTLSRAISVPDFLKSISNTLSTNTAFNFGELDEFEINFTHFVKENIDNRSILEIAYEQHAAFLMGGQTKGYDMVIVMKRKVNTNQEEVEYGLIVIQIKNYKDPVTNGERDDVINNCNPKLFVHLEVSKIVTIILAVGGEKKAGTIDAFTSPGDYAEMKKFPLRTTRSQSRTNTTAEDWLCMGIGLSSFKSLSDHERSLLYEIAQSQAETSTYPRTKIDAILQFGPFASSKSPF
jgi:hypothetical protein